MSMFVGTKRQNQRLSCRRKTCGLFSCVWVRATKLKKGWTSSSSSFFIFFLFFLLFIFVVGGSSWWWWLWLWAVVAVDVGSGCGFVGSERDENENKKKYFNEVVENIKSLMLSVL